MESGRESRGTLLFPFVYGANHQTYHFKNMLKAAGHEKRLIRLKVKETDLEEHKPSYEVAVAKLRQLYSRSDE
jgi:hypothetical protein